ncbi:MAG: phosphotransferase [Oscillospiraceae bacterium]|jgi:Ser/Thr protein kinase RdoA (MazF antagonist)|nr:phosphotransferase [Oscillospiraceae bacterium]
MRTGYPLEFEKLCGSLRLGKLAAEPKALTGGHLHRMFEVTTDTGKYAVKALNPQVMRRSEAMRNILAAERVANMAAKVLPAAPAKQFDCGVMPEADGQYYLVFDWIDGGTRCPEQIELTHCKTMGKLLADLHGVDFSALGLTDTPSFDEKPIDWDFYLQQGQRKRSGFVAILRKNLEHLYRWKARTMAAATALEQGRVISHGDLDPKNVVWQDDSPVIIDWEAAGAIHPLHDLVETALYWSFDKRGKIVPKKFKAFVNAYHRRRPIDCNNWQPVLDKGFSANLGWLEYSLKRALGLEGADELEQRRGAEQVRGTIRALRRHERDTCRIINWLEELQAGLG